MHKMRTGVRGVLRWGSLALVSLAFVGVIALSAIAVSQAEWELSPAPGPPVGNEPPIIIFEPGPQGPKAIELDIRFASSLGCGAHWVYRMWDDGLVQRRLWDGEKWKPQWEDID